MYRILPFQFKRFSNNEVLMVNECGDYYFLDDASFDLFTRHIIDENSDIFYDLKSKLFLAQEDYKISLEKIAARYRTRKLFLREFTSLHMLVITLRCNQRCEYCQVSCAEQDAHAYDMNEDVAEKIVDIIAVRLRVKKKVQNLSAMWYKEFAKNFATQGDFGHESP